MQNNLDTQKTRKNLIAIWTPKKPGKIFVPEPGKQINR